jgi:CheY-like chemotaxis protein
LRGANVTTAQGKSTRNPFWQTACFWLAQLAGLTPGGGIVNSSKTCNTPQVLLVDDECQQLELRAFLLSMAGYSVSTATGPFEALSLAGAIADLDIAILDYEMPIMNGCVLAQHLKSKFPNLNTVLYSGAVAIPPHDLEAVDTFISKSDGIPVLLHHLSDLSAVVRPIDTGMMSPLSTTIQNHR